MLKRPAILIGDSAVEEVESATPWARLAVAAVGAPGPREAVVTAVAVAAAGAVVAAGAVAAAAASVSDLPWLALAAIAAGVGALPLRSEGAPSASSASSASNKACPKAS